MDPRSHARSPGDEASFGGTAAELKRAFDNYARLSQNEKRDIARWWQLDQEGGVEPEVRQDAADSVRISEGKRLEAENEMQRHLAALLSQQGSASPTGSLSPSPSRGDDASLIYDLQMALTKSEASRSDALHRLEDLSREVESLKDADPHGELEASLARAEARAALAESKLAAAEDLLTRSNKRSASFASDRYGDPDDDLEERVDTMERALQEAADTVVSLKEKLEETETDMLRHRRQVKELKKDKERLSGLLTQRMHQLEDEAMQLQSLAKGRRAGGARGRSTSPSSGAGSPGGSHRFGRSSSHRTRGSSPAAGSGGGGGQGTRLGLEVADSIHVGRLGGDLKYDGVRVVAASRPAAPIIHDGDVIIKVDDSPVTNMQSFKKVVHGLDPHTSVLLTVRRKGPGGTSGVLRKCLHPPPPPHVPPACVV